MINDGPRNTALAREALITSFQTLYGVGETEGRYLCLAVLVALVQGQTRGVPLVTVPPGETRYYVGDCPLDAYLGSLADQQQTYHGLAQQDQRAALAWVQDQLLNLLLPRAAGAGLVR